MCRSEHFIILEMRSDIHQHEINKQNKQLPLSKIDIKNVLSVTRDQIMKVYGA